MAGICCCASSTPPILQPTLFGSSCLAQPHLTVSRRVRGTPRCFASRERETPSFLKIAVSGVTELLRLFSFGVDRSEVVMNACPDDISISDVDDIMTILRSDYENAYFVTGTFTSAIYADDCLFEDPTIRFRGKHLYLQNLKLLVPFFVHPSIELEKIEKGVNSKINFVSATWKLRTYLKLPWRPLISVDGNTFYELDDEFRIVRHAESWNISAYEAVAQIFIPSSRKSKG